MFMARERMTLNHEGEAYGSVEEHSYLLPALHLRVLQLQVSHLRASQWHHSSHEFLYYELIIEKLLSYELFTSDLCSYDHCRGDFTNIIKISLYKSPTSHPLQIFPVTTISVTISPCVSSPVPGPPVTASPPGSLVRPPSPPPHARLALPCVRTRSHGVWTSCEHSFGYMHKVERGSSSLRSGSDSCREKGPLDLRLCFVWDFPTFPMHSIPC